MMTTLEGEKLTHIQSVNNVSNRIQSDFLDVTGEKKTKKTIVLLCIQWDPVSIQETTPPNINIIESNHCNTLCKQ